jgi:excisionase family DNA binding protein
MTLDADLHELATRNALLDTTTVAETLGVTPWWVRRLIHSGELRAVNVSGPGTSAKWRVDPEDLSAFLAERQSRPRDLVARW